MHLERTIGAFVKALRNASVAVSPAETLDALQVARRIGLHDRTLFRDALALTLAKSPEEKARFLVCFERFFAFAPFAPEAQKRPRKGTEAGLTLTASTGMSDAQRPLADILLHDDRLELSLRLAAATTAFDLDGMRALRDKSGAVGALLDHMGIEALDATIARPAQEALDSQQSRQLLAARARLVRTVREYVDAQYLLRVDASGRRAIMEAALASQLTQISPAYHAEMRAAVRKVADRLTARHRRRRRRDRRGQLDVRHTLRRNLAYDGAPFDLRWRRVRVERPKVFALCDCSGSVAGVARFMLFLVYHLTELLPNIRTFAFSSQAGEVTDLFGRLPIERAIEEALFAWGKGNTDYGRSLMDFRAACLQDVDRRSTVIILGDGRNNYYDPHAEVLAEIATRARQVLWLNPEPRSQWTLGDGEMARFAPYCRRVVTCNSLQDLERFADQLLLSR